MSKTKCVIKHDYLGFKKGTEAVIDGYINIPLEGAVMNSIPNLYAVIIYNNSIHAISVKYIELIGDTDE